MAILIVFLGFTVSCLSGFLGIGGGIVLAPALLYLPPLLGVGSFDMRAVAGFTITQSLFACLSGAFRHGHYRCVHRLLVLRMGTTMFLSALAGGILSHLIPNKTLMALFAALAIIAAVLMLLPKEDGEEIANPNQVPFNLPRAILIALVIGLLGGIVGQGGSFILIPLMLYVLKLPTRVVIGSNLVLVFLSSLAGFMGKLTTGQIELLPALLLAAAAVPGAQIGSVLSQRTGPKWLRALLAAVVALAAVKITLDVCIDS
jgi:hypothetical protein